MPKRQDGKETRLRLLNAAAEVFARKGYRDAKVAEICKRAGANVAAVNYYFRDKARLYAETWRHIFQEFEEPILWELAGTSPQERLLEYIQTLIKDFSKEGGLGQFGRLYLMELLNPTGLIEESWLELIDPRREKLHEIIREIIGHDIDHQTVLFCELSIINQCRALLTIKRTDLEYVFKHALDDELLNRLADHIADFSLGGIKAIGKGLA